VGYNVTITTKAVITFDAGQTLVELDLDFLARRLASRGVHVEQAALGAAAPAAWATYDRLVAEGIGHPWRSLMQSLLAGAGVAEPTPHVEWLWAQQPVANLWRKPIPAMLDLARELAARGQIVAVLSNSEGKLAELFEEIRIADAFVTIVDSGRVGIEKPDRRIFDHTLAAVGADRAGIHIGDSWAADVVGARGAGWRAIWFGPKVTPVDDPDVAIARDAAETRAALVRWGVL
jgi:putative hydrolase of the HAD superfamily